MARIRGWQEELEDVNIEFVERISLGDYLEKKFKQDYTEERTMNEEFPFKWLDLLDKDTDYCQSLLNSYIAATAAIYSPEEKKILLGDWLPPSLAEVILVHELVHAFQDNEMGLEEFLDSTTDNLDLFLLVNPLLKKKP